VTCHEFERWLDEGRIETAEASRHAATCAACALSLRAAIAVDGLLAHATLVAPSRFTAQVMARVGVEASRQRVPLFELLPTLETLPWWVRAAAEPTCVLAAVLVALVAWAWPWLSSIANGAPALLALGIQTLQQQLPADLLSTTVTESASITGLALALAVTPLILLAHGALARWGETLISPRPAHLRLR
jgi:hypothetical protein